MTGSALPAPRVEVHESADELATSVAGAFLRLVAVRQGAGDVPRIALTGGSIAERIHREIARLGSDSDVDWSRVEILWGDERFVAPDSDDRNALLAHRDFLDALPLSRERVHEVPSTADAADVDDAAAQYDEVVRRSGAIDLLMLGVGPDAHVASLFPGHPLLDVTDRVAVAISDSPKPPPERVTLTFPTLNESEEVWFVVSGSDKAEAVGRALATTPPDPHEIPAAGVRGRLQTIWFLDRGSASQVP